MGFVPSLNKGELRRKSLFDLSEKDSGRYKTLGDSNNLNEISSFRLTTTKSPKLRGARNSMQQTH